MKRAYKKYIILFLFGIHLISNGQNNNGTDSVLPLPAEKVNLFTDRDIYLSGETIWFHASISLGNNLEAVSNILYIELFNSNQRSIVKKKYKINQGFAEGVLDIPTEFLSDVYFLRAYTHYNKNFPVESYFVTAIQIINPKKGIPASVETKISNEITVDSINQYSIESLSPKDGMQLVSIYKSHKTIGDNIYSLDLLDSKQQIISRAEFSITSQTTKIAFPNATFKKQGLYYYLLKDQEDEILRVQAFIFKNIQKPFSRLELTTKEFKKRDSVIIDLNKYTSQYYSRFGIKIAQRGSILSSFDKLELFIGDPFLLMNYLKTIFNPIELSPKEEISSILALNEKLNIAEYKSLFYPINVYEQKWIPGLKDIGLSGIAVDKISQKPLPNIPIYLSLSDDRPQIYVTKSRNDGSFQFSINSFANYKDALLCPLYKGIDEVELKVSREFTAVFQELKSIPLKIDSSYIDLLEQMLLSSQTTKKIKIRSAKQDFKIRNLPYSFDDPDVSVVLDDYVETPTLNIIFKELVSGVRVRKRKDNYKLFVFDTIRSLLYVNPLILIDDIPIYDVDELLKIPPKAIEKIEVHSSPFIMENHIIYGVVKISTLTDNFGGMNMHKSSRFFKYQTLDLNYIFDTKTYKTAEEFNSRSADFRTLLYWNPIIQNINNKINFYTSDQTGDYEAYIFGTNANGQAFQKKLFELKVSD